MMLNVSDLLEKAKGAIKEKTGAKLVLFDPQPVERAQPNLRLTFTGSTVRGRELSMEFQTTILAGGDGPEVFLSSVIELSANVSKAFEDVQRNYQDIEFDSGKHARIYYHPVRTNSGSGQFVRNEDQGTEANQFRFTYVEPHIISISVRMD
jgi:hypothetical protein